VRHGIATVCMSGSLQAKLDAAADAGFDGVELFEPDLAQSGLSAAQVRRAADELGLSIDLFQPFRDFEAVTPTALGRNLERACATFELMEQLGARTLLVCSNVAPDAIDDDTLAAEQLDALAAVAAN
jgi:4-hydroxyphenylpyruvate dioxygenase